LVEDHVRARRLADALAEHPDFRIDPAGVQTNIVVAGLREPASTDRVLRRLAQAGVLAGAMGPGRIRFVTHLDVDDRGLSRAIDVVARLRSD
ncbi:MAG TPA: hypothetical protein VD788_00245, partial [Candidatus Polarisedimenticolaceae bacterium]|nr:hypothetical protein [Candidatus Polarisedimenticolaceae bacterium]